MQRADFKAIYDGLSNQQYVDKPEQMAGVTLANKAQLVTALDAQTKTRVQVAREVVESGEMRRRMCHDALLRGRDRARISAPQFLITRLFR